MLFHASVFPFFLHFERVRGTARQFTLDHAVNIDAYISHRANAFKCVSGQTTVQYTKRWYLDVISQLIMISSSFPRCLCTL